MDNSTGPALDVVAESLEPVGELGLYCAYAALLIMALIPIWVGSHRSLAPKSEEEQADTMTKEDAMYFPFIASGFLFSLYMVFKIFGKEYINLLLTAYFFVLGVLAVAHVLSPLAAPYLPPALKTPFALDLTKGAGTDKKVLVELRFDYGDLACLAVGAALGGWYLYEKHWVANNIFGLAFSVNGIEMLSLDTFMVGCYLLGGLFVYDIFWVFATDVMVTVAKSFEAPIKLLFPKDLLVNGWHSTQFTMLGLGDIVIPGIFIALMLRFDRSRAPGGQESAAGAGFARPYFLACFAAYIVGLVVTVTVMHVFRAAQPALLYLVPACLGSVTLLAVARREMPLLLAYKDTPEAEAAQAQEEPKKEL